jgi:hypothetical protein
VPELEPEPEHPGSDDRSTALRLAAGSPCPLPAAPDLMFSCNLSGTSTP